MASSGSVFKRSDSIADSMPEALRQCRYHMKKCFAKYVTRFPPSYSFQSWRILVFTFFFLNIFLKNRYVGQGRRIMKLHHLREEMEKSIEDKLERAKVLESLLGYILSSTQVLNFFSHLLFSIFKKKIIFIDIRGLFI